MSFELKWLVYTVVLTAVLWLPYVLNRIIVQGLIPAMGYPNANTPPHSAWAERAMKAHSNAVENLVLFAPLVLALHVLGISTEATRTAVLSSISQCAPCTIWSTCSAYHSCERWYSP